MFSRTITIVVTAGLLSWVPVASLASADPLSAPAPQEKSESGAMMRSLFGTIVPVVLTVPYLIADSDESSGKVAAGVFLGSGLLVGPSLGHFYADSPGRAFSGIAWRLVAFAALTVGVGMSYDEENTAGDLLVLGGLVASVGLIVWDIARAPSSARSYNERQRRISVGFAAPTRTEGPGVVAIVSF